MCMMADGYGVLLLGESSASNMGQDSLLVQYGQDRTGMIQKRTGVARRVLDYEPGKGLQEG